LESRPSIRLGGRGDIAALGIQDHGDFIWNGSNYVLKNIKPLRTKSLEKSAVGLESRGYVRGVFYYLKAEIPDCLYGINRKVRGVRIMSYAE
jgi:hypothetical protein